MHTIHREQLLPRPRDEIFPFFAAARNLERITPAFLRFRVLTPEPIILRPGGRIDYTLRLAGVPFHWRTRIEAFDPPLSFVDVQEKGPYRRWRHRHEFHEVTGGTLMVDDVEYEVGWGIPGALAHTLFVRRALDRIFDHRRQIIAGIFGA